MKKTLASGMIGLLALGGAVSVAPQLASAQDDAPSTSQELTPEQQERLDARQARIEARLAEMVDSGEISQEQADEMLARFESGDFEGRRGRGHRGHKRGIDKDVVADVLGVSVEELRDAAKSGQSLADIAAAQGVDVDVLIDTLVANANSTIDEKVAAGELDEARADEIKETLEEKITAKVNRARGEGNGAEGPAA